jgi:hypothetical protein
MTTATATATATTTTTTSTTLTVTKKLERHPDLSLEQSNSIVKWCRDAIDQNKDFLYDTLIFEQAIQQACQHYDLQPQSLTSLLRNTHVWHVKITTRHVKLKLQNHVERYVQGESILEIARDNRYPPYLLARAMLEVLLLNTNKNSSGRKGLTEAMRDPIGKLGHVSCICEEYRSSENNTEEQPLTRLAREVMHVIAVDPMYGPEHDEVRHNIGVEYEELLEQVLTSMGKCVDVAITRLCIHCIARPPRLPIYLPYSLTHSLTHQNQIFPSKPKINYENEVHLKHPMFCFRRRLPSG